MDYENCDFFHKVEIDYDVFNGHSSYRCFCTKDGKEREIVPYYSCNRCKGKERYE